MSAALEVRDLTVAYEGNIVLDRVTFSVGEGALVGIVGPNGAGKSTLLKAILGLIPRTRGSVQDRKSTRLNSSHVKISYAVFCLKSSSTTQIYTLSLHDALPILSAALEVRDLTVAYEGNIVLDRVTFSVGEGALVGIVGPNGAGKSTLLKAILGLIPRTRGSV